MWVVSIKIHASELLLSSTAVKFGIDLIGYPLSYVKKEHHLEVNVCGYIFGSAEKKQTVLDGIKKKPQLMHIEEHGGFIVAQIQTPHSYAPLFAPGLIRPRPTYISHEGWQTWEFAGWDRDSLNEIIGQMQEHYNLEVLSIVEQDIGGITLPGVVHTLTEKQRAAIELAIEHGYYAYPRKISVHELAELATISYATYQEHLRKAEAKVIPSFMHN